MTDTTDTDEHHYGVHHCYRAETRHEAIGKAAIAGRILAGEPWHEYVEPIPRPGWPHHHDQRTYVRQHWQVVYDEIDMDLFWFLADLETGHIDCDACGETVHYYWNETRVTWLRIGDEVVCSECIVGLLEDIDEVVDGL